MSIHINDNGSIRMKGKDADSFFKAICQELDAPKSNYDKLCAAADQLRKSERGQKVLASLERFFRDGGLSLDDANKRAAAKLFMAALHNPWDLPANLTSKQPGRQPPSTERRQHE